jgi:hypothetical protein
MVRGSDSEAREGGGFEAARANGIHGAVDLDGYLGEPVFAVVDGKVQLAVESDRGKLGKTVVVDHLDGGYTIYGHLRTVDVKRGSSVTAGQVLGTMGYSGNARRLQEKNLPPHLHFAYVRATVPFAGIRAIDGLGTSFARNNAMAEMMTSVLHPIRVVGFRKCWEDATSPSPRPEAPGRDRDRHLLGEAGRDDGLLDVAQVPISLSSTRQNLSRSALSRRRRPSG